MAKRKSFFRKFEHIHIMWLGEPEHLEDQKRYTLYARTHAVAETIVVGYDGRGRFRSHSAEKALERITEMHKKLLKEVPPYCVVKVNV